MNDDYEYIYKIVTAGNSGVGKSCILNRYINQLFDEYSDSTIGVDFFISKMRLPSGETAKLQIWDLAGQYEFNNIVKSYFRNIVGAILVFDLTNRQSFNDISYWIEKIKIDGEYTNDNIQIILVGSKADLQKVIHVVTDREIQELMDKYPKNIIQYIKTSSKTGLNVDEVFTVLVNNIYKYNVSIGEPFKGRRKPMSIDLRKTVNINDGNGNKTLFGCCSIL